MFKTIRIAALAAGLSLMTTPALAQSSTVVGTWATAVDIMGSKVESTMTVASADGAYTVDIKDGPMPGAPADAPPMESTISDVAVDGATLTFKRALNSPQGPLNLSYRATADGDKLTGEIVSDFGPLALTGTRK